MIVDAMLADDELDDASADIRISEFIDTSLFLNSNYINIVSKPGSIK